jgi:hypothetical protein
MKLMTNKTNLSELSDFEIIELYPAVKSKLQVEPFVQALAVDALSFKRT